MNEHFRVINEVFDCLKLSAKHEETLNVPETLGMIWGKVNTKHREAQDAERESNNQGT